MDIGPELIGALISGAIGGAIGAWRANNSGTKTSLEKGNTAFKDLRDDNKELSDRLSKLEGAFELAVRLRVLKPEPPSIESQPPPP